jgi:lipoate-protein ligase A
VFHEGTLAFGWTMPITSPRSGIQERFEALSQLMVRVFARLGVVSAVGEIPGEYCPGRFSVHHSGNRKVMGVGQRLAQNAAHVGGVIVVGGADAINEVLLPVYAALGVGFEPAATGALSDLVPDLTMACVVAAIVAELQALGEISVATLSSAMVQRGRDMLPDHLIGASGG